MKTHLQLFLPLGVLTFALFTQGCGSSSATSTLSVPVVATLVKAALPTGLKAGNKTTVTPSALRLRYQEDLKDLSNFSVTPSNSNGNLASGYIINLFQD